MKLGLQTPFQGDCANSPKSQKQTKSNFNFNSQSQLNDFDLYSKTMPVQGQNGNQKNSSNQIFSISTTSSPKNLQSFQLNRNEIRSQNSLNQNKNLLWRKQITLSRQLLSTQSDNNLRKKFPKIVDQQTLQKVSSILKGDATPMEEDRRDLEFKIIQYKTSSLTASPKNIQSELTKISDRGLILSSKMKHKRKQSNPLPLMKHTSTKGISDDDKESVEQLNA